MPQWFPAIRAALARRGLHLPQPYPHTARTLLGSALAALLTGSLIGIFYVIYNIALFTVDLTFQATESLSRVTAELGATSEQNTPSGSSQTMTVQTPERRATNSNATESPEDIPHEGKRQAPLKNLLPDDAILQEARGPLTRKDLPYPESRRLSFADAVRQVDFALVQTFLRLNLDTDRIVLLTSAYREHNGENYQYQRMRIFLPPVAAEAAEGLSVNRGNSTLPPPKEERPLPRRIVVDAMADFVGTLEENLDAWASRSILSEQPGKIQLSIGSVVTHEIWLDVTSNKFVAAPEKLFSPTSELVIVMSGLGSDPEIVETLLALPFPVTLAIEPSAVHARQLAEEAWKAGYEILLHQPMQSSQWPYVKAGPNEITTKMSDEMVAGILNDALEKVPHASGLANHMGSGLCGNRAASAQVTAQTATAGLYLLDTMARHDSFLYLEATRQGLPAWKQDFSLDDGHPSKHVVLASLKKAEKLAIRQGRAIVGGRPYPETLEALRDWATTRDKTVRIVSLRALSHPGNR